MADLRMDSTVSRWTDSRLHRSDVLIISLANSTSVGVSMVDLMADPICCMMLSYGSVCPNRYRSGNASKLAVEVFKRTYVKSHTPS